MDKEMAAKLEGISDDLLIEKVKLLHNNTTRCVMVVSWGAISDWPSPDSFAQGRFTSALRWLSALSSLECRLWGHVAATSLAGVAL
jgi:hypothetical protein